MTQCPSCAAAISDSGRFCSACGTPLKAPSSAPTETSTPSQLPTADPEPTPSHPSLAHFRFVPGTVLDNRYRIVGLLGRGGMGEVYRADDLKLGQSVALKFLPVGLERDKRRLGRFLDEVRTARQVTHSNVCRVYDIAEVDGQHYLSMEYVDGEDLASLLRRIGRLPKDKALQIARQICAGLGAAHEQGILHRDLKPANVMIDGSGRAKITDFGLAGLEQTIQDGEIRSGTPAYMAPEQLAGEEVTVRSDVYALGLVLYELFTGRPAFAADTPPTELVRVRRESTPTSPSSHVDGFDPAVERVILRCLERSPGDRPAAALAVSAALPGGDPLAAALAAGETPSPEMVAEADVTGGLRPPVAVACLALVLLGLASLPFQFEKSTALGQDWIGLPPEVLSRTASEIVRLAGYSDPPTDRAIGFRFDRDYFEYERQRDPTEQWKEVRRASPAPFYFWYRQSPQLLTPLSSPRSGRVTPTDPPPVLSGMIGLRLDLEGRLIRLEVVPPQVDERTDAGPPVDWSELFARAGLDLAEFDEVEPVWDPLAANGREAWLGTYSEQPDVPIRVEAAAYRGRPVSFRIVAPWTKARRLEPARSSVVPTVAMSILAVVLVAVVFGAIALARSNLRRGRGDRRGASIIAVVAFANATVYWILTADHRPTFAEIYLFFQQTAWALLYAALAWVLYIALEPHARRLLPETLISWNRLLQGRFRDPLVGRDVLVGILFGLVMSSGVSAAYLFSELLFQQAITPVSGTYLDSLVSTRRAVALFNLRVNVSLILTVSLVFLLLLLYLVLRRRWLAVTGFTFVIVLLLNPFGANIWMITLPVALITAGVATLVLTRFGILTTVCMGTVSGPNFYTLTSELSSWYAGRSVATLLVIAAVASYGFYVSLAGRPLIDLERAGG